MLSKQTENGSKCIGSKDALSKANTESRNSNTKEYTTLPAGSFALMQCHISKKWERAVRIIRARDNGSSYVVEGVSTGKQYIRGRRLLKPHSNPHFHEDSEPTEDSVNREPQKEQEPLRTQPPRAAKRKMSYAHFANRTQHVWTSTPSGLPCQGIRQAHQFQPHDEYPVVWIPYSGNQRQWGPEPTLLAPKHLRLICHCTSTGTTQPPGSGKSKNRRSGS